MSRQKTAIQPTRAENYPEWYQQVIIAADLAENSPVRGCMVIKPWGYAIWENMQRYLDRRFKATGHVNAYFPLLIPLNHLSKEAEHVEGFAKECAVVTHSRLKTDGENGLVPDSKLEEPLVIRPTSETIIGEMYAKWVNSWRDLPILINQWANVMRWEMRTRLFLRTSEFLWQEGHTAHETAEEALTETLMMLDIYSDFVETQLAIPVIKGEKYCAERFPGAVNTYTIEAMMQDGKALQSGTSHFLGQNFSKSANIQFTNREGTLSHVWTSSWGFSTRMIGGLIMTHSDDNGLVLPPRIAPKQLVIIPIFRSDDERQQVFDYCEKLKQQLESLTFADQQPIEVEFDRRNIRGGDKVWQWIKRGTPLRVEIGPRDIANNSVMLSRRDQAPKEKTSLTCEQLMAQVSTTLDQIQQNLFERAKNYRDENSAHAEDLETFKAMFTADSKKDIVASPFVTAYAVDDPVIEEHLKPLKASSRCMPLADNDKEGRCIFTGKKTQKKMVFAKAY